MQQRRKIGMRMRLLAQKIARTKARKKKRMKTKLLIIYLLKGLEYLMIYLV